MSEKKTPDRWSEPLKVVDEISKNPSRHGEHLDIRIVGPGLSVTLMSLEDFRELIARAQTWRGLN